jgi:serine/threonine-protein kinase RsbW
MSESTATGPRAAGERPREGERVALTLPASGTYLAVVRTTTATLAARNDFVLDDVEDLRIAADEACAMLLADALPGTSLTCEFAIGADSLAMSVTARVAGGREPDRDSFSWTVLNALADELTSRTDGENVTLVLTKRRSVEPAT